MLFYVVWIGAEGYPVKKYKVYGVKKLDKQTFFLLYNTDRGWYWSDSCNYRPVQ